MSVLLERFSMDTTESGGFIARFVLRLPDIPTDERLSRLSVVVEQRDGETTQQFRARTKLELQAAADQQRDQYEAVLARRLAVKQREAQLRAVAEAIVATLE